MSARPRSLRPSRATARRACALLATTSLALAGASTLLGPAPGTASSHREAPLIANDPAADNTDLYAFRSPSRPGHVVFVSNWQPFSEPAGGPNFYPYPTDARYYVRIDNDGDAKADISFRWTFRTIDRRGLDTFLYNDGAVTGLRDPNLRFRQTYDLVRIDEDGTKHQLVDDGPVVPSRVGNASMPAYADLREQGIRRVHYTGRSFVGQADDPFFLDLRVFDLLYGADLSETGDDTLAGFNVNSVVLEVPISSVTRRKDPVIGVWTTTERRSLRLTGRDGSQRSTGPFVQVSRLGNPLVNEVVIPAGLKDAFNALRPRRDADVAAAVDRVLDPELARLLEAIYGIPAPATPRDDLVAVYLTGIDGLNRPKAKNQRPAEMLRLNTSTPVSPTPHRLGVLGGDLQGFPNGRRLTDDVVDISLQAVAGAVRTGLVEALAAGDRVDRNDRRFSRTFPYLALPHSGSNAAVHSDPPATGAAATGASWSAGSGLPIAGGLAGLGLTALAGALVLRERRTRPSARLAGTTPSRA